MILRAKPVQQFNSAACFTQQELIVYMLYTCTWKCKNNCTL